MHLSPFPASLKKIGICSPSKLPDPGELQAGLDLIHSYGIETVCAENILTAGEEDYFGGSDITRANDLNSLIRDDSIQLILCSRGGYGAAYLPGLIDWDLLRKRNLPICGYSDITALHLAMMSQHAGCPVMTPMVKHIPVLDGFTTKYMKRAIACALGESCPPETLPLQPLTTLTRQITAPLVPVNLSLLISYCGTPWMPDLRNTIIAVEDVDEEPRKIDRMMLQLELAGIIRNAAAIIIGSFSGACGSDDEKMRIFRRFSKRNPDTPFLTGLPFAHCIPSFSFVAGQQITITTTAQISF